MNYSNTFFEFVVQMEDGKPMGSIIDWLIGLKLTNQVKEEIYHYVEFDVGDLMCEMSYNEFQGFMSLIFALAKMEYRLDFDGTDEMAAAFSVVQHTHSVWSRDAEEVYFGLDIDPNRIMSKALEVARSKLETQAETA